MSQRISSVQAERECAVWKEKEQNVHANFEQYRTSCSKSDAEMTSLRQENTKLTRQLNSLQRDLGEMRTGREK